MGIISAKGLIKRWHIDYEDLYNKINAIDIPVYVETLGYYTTKVPETKWTRLDPMSVDFGTLSADNCPYLFKLEDIKSIEIQTKGSLADIFIKKKLPQGMELDDAISILKGGCNEIFLLYKNLRGVTSTDSDAPIKWKDRTIKKFNSEKAEFRYLKGNLLDDIDIYTLATDNPKRDFTGKLLKSLLDSKDLLDSINTRSYKKIAKIFTRVTRI